uniref:Uncharacterized protein n=1 Tax=Tanacetum cinerariifolium TaxID=118510 RepID=A0A6L2KPP1_TANCI|nr:hypothetical protein [Tanacetum cinerariifolium]
MNRQLLDSQKLIYGMTPTQALTAIQTMADHSQKWHDGSSSRIIDSSSNSEGITAIEVKTMEEVKYEKFDRPFPNNSRNDGGFNRGVSGYGSYDQPSSGFIIFILNLLGLYGLMGGAGTLLSPIFTPKDGKLGSTSIKIAIVSSTPSGSPIGSSYASNHDRHLGALLKSLMHLVTFPKGLRKKDDPKHGGCSKGSILGEGLYGG